MKTLDETIQEVKDLIKDWDWKEEDDIEHILESTPVLTLVEEVAHRFAQSVAQQALENASENFRESFLRTDNIHKAITNPDNIPTI